MLHGAGTAIYVFHLQLNSGYIYVLCDLPRARTIAATGKHVSAIPLLPIVDFAARGLGKAEEKLLVRKILKYSREISLLLKIFFGNKVVYAPEYNEPVGQLLYP